MSKNISIKEGNVGKSFSDVKKIAIKDIGGSGSSFWVPEDETKLGTKHITENGTYKASEEVDEQRQSKNLYGYSEVTVSGVGVATGVDPETGEGMTTDTDENGNERRLPAPWSLAWQRQPFITTYEDGQDISLTGAEIYAKTKKGNVWQGDETYVNGVIPLSEFVLDPTKADKSKATGVGEKELDGVTIDYLPAYNAKQRKWGSRLDFIECKSSGYVARYKTANNDTRGVIMSTEQTVLIVQHNPQDESYTSSSMTLSPLTLSNGDVVYVDDSLAEPWCQGGDWTHGGAWQNPPPEGTITPPINEVAGGLTTQQVANILFLGTQISGGGQTINVEWTYPKNGKKLTTSFDIDVVDAQE